jgi:hypothetical protein
MIPAAVIAAVLVGIIIGLAIAGIYNARTIAPVERRAHWTAVGGNVSAESVDSEWQKQIFRQMANNRFFEIRYL